MENFDRVFFAVAREVKRGDVRMARCAKSATMAQQGKAKLSSGGAKHSGVSPRT